MRAQILASLLAITTCACTANTEQGDSVAVTALTDDSSTIALSALLSAPSEIEPSDEVVGWAERGVRNMVPGGDMVQTDLDTSLIRFAAKISDEMSAYVLPYEAMAGLCLLMVDSRGSPAAQTCTDTSSFNLNGLSVAMELVDGDLTVLLVPEGTEVDPGEKGTTYPSGVVLTVAGLRPGLAVVDGKVSL